MEREVLAVLPRARSAEDANWAMNHPTIALGVREKFARGDSGEVGTFGVNASEASRVPSGGTTPEGTSESAESTPRRAIRRVLLERRRALSVDGVSAAVRRLGARFLGASTWPPGRLGRVRGERRAASQETQRLATALLPLLRHRASRGYRPPRREGRRRGRPPSPSPWCAACAAPP